MWQGGGNLGSYLGLLSSPSGIAGNNTFRLDSWWFEKRWLSDHVAARVGQFAGQDSYGDQDYGTSFVMQPLGGSLNNLSNDFESFDPPSTSALEVRVVPIHHFYVKSMVLAADRMPYSNNPTGLVPQFRGAPVSVSEIGFTPGKKALPIHPADNTDSRKGYSGFYRFGASYNPARFAAPASGQREPGNYVLYWTASQAVWRVDPKEAKGLDATVAYDWSPTDVNRQNTTFTAGLRFNEPLPVNIHNTISLGYVQNGLSPQFLPAGITNWKRERGVELNSLLHVFPMILLQPVVQYYANVGGVTRHAMVAGFRSKVEF